MSDSSQRPCCRGDNYEAPTKAPSKLYPYEKGKFAGGLSGAALYGTLSYTLIYRFSPHPFDLLF